MITPKDLLLSLEELRDLISDAEKKFLEERAAIPPAERENCVKLWIRISRSQITEDMMHCIYEEYKKYWSHVQISMQEDRGERMYIYLYNAQ